MFWGFLGVYGEYFGQSCLLAINVCAPPVWVVGGREPVGGSLGVGGGSWNAGRLALQGW